MASQDDTERFEIPSAGGEDDDLTAELFRSAFRPPGRVTGVTYRWRELTAAQAGSVWGDLAVWVRWLVATYQLTTSVVPDCWWRHTEIVAELYALQRAELASYASDDPGFRAARLSRAAAARRRASADPYPDGRLRRPASAQGARVENPAVGRAGLR